MTTFICTFLLFLHIHCFSFICEWVSAHGGQCRPLQVELGCIRSLQRASEQASWSVHVLSASVTIYMCVSVWLNVCCVEGGCGCVWRSEVVGSPGVEVTDCCGLQCGCWGLNSGPLLSLALCLRHCQSSCLDSSWGWNVTRKQSPNKSCPPPSWLWTAFSPSDRTARQDKCRPFYVRCTRF